MRSNTVFIIRLLHSKAQDIARLTFCSPPPLPEKRGEQSTSQPSSLDFSTTHFTHFPVLLKQFNEFYVQERRKWEEEYGRNSDGVALAL
jgi:hypothetical protein